MKTQNMNRVKKALAFLLTFSMLMPGTAMAAQSDVMTVEVENPDTQQFYEIVVGDKPVTLTEGESYVW